MDQLDRHKYDSLPRLNASNNNAIAAVTTLRDDTARDSIQSIKTSTNINDQNQINTIDKMRQVRSIEKAAIVVKKDGSTGLTWPQKIQQQRAKT